MKIRRSLEILELQPGASLDDVKRAYKDIVTVWHPDRFSHNPRLKKKAEGRIKEINAAYDTLTKFMISSSGLDAQKRRKDGSERGSQSRMGDKPRTKTEAYAEAGTRMVLTFWSHLSKRFRNIG